MTLDLNWRNVRDYENICEVPDPERPGKRTTNPVTYIMGILSMHVGINHITPSSAAEFYARAKLVEACFGGGLLNLRGKTVGITPDDVYAHIGLTSNASRYTPTQFYKHLRADVARELHQQYTYAIAAKEREAATAGATAE